MKKLLILLFLLISFTIDYGQIKVHKNISTKDGLISNQIRSIHKDVNGFLWIATMGGISKWDGTNFKNYSQSNGLEYFQTFDIFEASDSSLYFATFGKSIIRIKNNQLDTIDTDDGLISNFIIRIIELSDGSVVFSGADGTITKFYNGTFQLLDIGMKKRSTIYDMIIDNDKIYFATHDLGLGIVEGDSIRYFNTAAGLPSNLVWDIEIYNDGRILIATDNGVCLLENSKITNTTLFGNKINTGINQILVSSNSEIYYGGVNGLYKETKSEFVHINKKNGLSEDNIICLYETSTNEIFVGLDNGGFDIYLPNRLQNSTDFFLSNNSITAIHKSSDGKFYYGTNNGLLVNYNDKVNLLTTKEGLIVNEINSIAEANDGKIFVGTTFNGLNVIDGNNIYALPIFEGLTDNKITNLYYSTYGELFISTFRGVYIYDNISFKKINISNGLVSNYTTDICIAKDSSIFYASHGKGVSINKNEKFSYLSTQNGLSSNNINNIYERSDGAILIGTDQGGLNIYHMGMIDTITTSHGLLSNQIRAIAEDKLGNIYLSTVNGVNIISFVDRNFNLRSITEKDGLVSNDCNYNSLFVDNDNTVWIGTSKGISEYNPTFDKINTTPPNIIISGLQIFNKSKNIEDFKKNPTLNYDQNYLKFNYVGLELVSPHKTNYKYRLSGIDPDWVLNKNNSVQYTNLDHGSYQFEVKAQNEWGYWSEPAQLSFIITPAWWETWWFYSITIIALTGLIAFIASYRYKQLLAIEKVRTKISSDLHDNIGSGLTEITFLSEMVKSQVRGNEIANNGLGNITEISKTLINDMRDIVWLVNPSNATLQDLFNRLQDSYQEVLRYSDINFIVNGVDQLSKVSLPINFRQNIYLMFKEAINNSIKYSECKNIKLVVKTENDYLLVEMNDDGKGFDINNEKSGNGLKNIRNRAKQIKGDVKINSELNKGTSISFSGKFSKLQLMEI